MELVRHVTVGQYLPGSSLLHRLDPRTKIFLMMAAMVATFTIEGPCAVGVVAGLCLAGAFVARLPMRFFLGGLRSVALLLIATFVFNAAFVRGGPVLLDVAGFSLTARGLAVATLMTTRLVLLYLLTSLFTLTTSPLRITDALEILLSPARRIGLPASEIAMMASIALRFIPTLVETTEKIMKSQMARGAPIHEGHLLSRARSLVPVLVPLMLHSFQAAEDLATAMEARCYRGGRRTRMVTLSYRPEDLWALCGVGALLVAAAWLDVLVPGRLP